MHRAVEHKTTVSSRRFTIRGSLLYLIFYRLVNMIIVSSFFVCRIFYPVADKKDLILSFLFALYMANAKAIIRIYASVTLNVIFF